MKKKMRKKKPDFSRFADRPCQLCKDDVAFVDYKDTELLRKYMTDRGKIKPRKVTGACQQHQHDIENAIKRARIMALLPYVVTVTTRRGRRR